MVLLYDGVCGFCNGLVRLILRHDRKRDLKFAALQSDYARNLLSRFPEFAGVDTVVLYEPASGSKPERVSIRSTAALRVARYLGGIWNLTQVAYLVPRFIRDYIYDLFAKYRYRWFGKYDTCQIPPPEVRSRFLDGELVPPASSSNLQAGSKT